jgi:hypothetical protein
MGIMMKRLVGFAWMLLATSAGAGQLGHVAVRSGDGVRLILDVAAGRDDAAGLICQIGARHELPPKLVVKIHPTEVKIPDNSKKGAPLAAVAVCWSNGVPFTGKVRLSLTKNQGGICELAGMELRLGRDTGRVDDYTTSVCTVTAAQMRQKPYGH